ncbi:MAG: transposase [Armatimonadetes bacterium]|nr:transposase [Armatimonadota bacterium]
MRPQLVDEDWEDVLEWLPEDLDAIAKETKALLRKREITSGEDLLRLAMGYTVLDLSLRGVAAWADRIGLASMSDVAVLQRLKNSEGYLAFLLKWMIKGNQVYPVKFDAPLRVRLVDASTVSAPGSTGTDWRIHLGYDAVRGLVDHVEITDARGGEHLGRFEPGPGDLIVGDRGYAHGNRIAAAMDVGAHVLVRIGHSAVRLWKADGERFDPLEFVTRRRGGPGRPPRVEETAAYVRGEDERPREVRIICIRKSQEAADQERVRLRREAKRRGRQPTKRTLKAAAFTWLICSAPAKLIDARVAGELYRFRWQVELYFKRLKSLGDLDQLRAFEPALVRTYILGKLLAMALADRITAGAIAFSPWGVPLLPLTDESMAANTSSAPGHHGSSPWQGASVDPLASRPSHP